LSPFFPEKSGGEPIGEAWFTSETNQTTLGKSFRALLEEAPEVLGAGGDPQFPGVCPLLVKILFTTSRLSVQVHPDDEYAAKHHQSLGKTEAWYVMDSQAPGEVAVGFRETISPQRLESSALSGEIEQLLDWKPVTKGDVVYVPAGTVHAIGAGLTICEIQENSDITYRLYDYGRPRELHLEHGKQVSHLSSHHEQARRVTLAPGRTQLVESVYFRIEHLAVTEQMKIAGGNETYLVLVALAGKGRIAGEAFEAGQVWLVPAQTGDFVVDGAGSEWLLTYRAEAAYRGVELT
jgi:mannose-6-phosphate isomerase